MKRAGQRDTRASNPPSWCGALDKDSCAAHFSTTIHGEPRHCQWLDVGCRSGNVSMCAIENKTYTNVTRTLPVVADDTVHDGIPLLIVPAATALLVAVLLWLKARFRSSSGHRQLAATREGDGELDRLADQILPGGAQAEFVDFRDDHSQITFLPDEDFRILREVSNDDGSEVTFLPDCLAAEYAQEPPTQLEPPQSSVEGEELRRMFTQEHAADAASRFRLACQLRERTEPSKPPRRDHLAESAKRLADVATHDFDIPTARTQQKTAKVAAIAVGAAPLEHLPTPRSSSVAQAQHNYSLD